MNSRTLESFWYWGWGVLGGCINFQRNCELHHECCERGKEWDGFMCGCVHSSLVSKQQIQTLHPSCPFLSHIGKVYEIRKKKKKFPFMMRSYIPKCRYLGRERCEGKGCKLTKKIATRYHLVLLLKCDSPCYLSLHLLGFGQCAQMTSSP